MKRRAPASAPWAAVVGLAVACGGRVARDPETGHPPTAPVSIGSGDGVATQTDPGTRTEDAPDEPAPVGAQAEASGGGPPADDRRRQPGADARRAADARAARLTLVELEEIPEAGAIRKHPTRDRGTRLRAIVPLSGDGRTVFEVLGLPQRAPGELMVAVRSLHLSARREGCEKLAVELDGRRFELKGVDSMRGTTQMGTMEATRGAATMDRLARLNQAERVRVHACDAVFTLDAAVRPTLKEFVHEYERLRNAAIP